MAIVQHSIEQSRVQWLQFFMLALVVIIVALALTLIFNGPGAPNTYSITTDPGAALYTW